MEVMFMFHKPKMSWPGLVAALGAVVVSLVGIIFHHARASRKLELQATNKIPPDPAPVYQMERSRPSRTPESGDPDEDGGVSLTGT